MWGSRLSHGIPEYSQTTQPHVELLLISPSFLGPLPNVRVQEMDNVGLGDLLGESPNLYFARQPALFKHIPHFYLHNQDRTITSYKKKILN